MLSKKRLFGISILLAVMNIGAEIFYGHTYSNGWLLAAALSALAFCVKEK